MADKSFTEQLESIFLPAQADMRIKAMSQAGYLFRWTVGRLLLGEDTAEAHDWLVAQLDDFEPSGSVKKEMNKWLHLLACAAALGVQPKEQAQRACDYLDSERISDGDYTMVQIGLALSILGERHDRASEWLAKQYAQLPRPEAETFAFELLVMASAQIEQRQFGVQLLCDVASRVFVESLWAPPPYSAAPHFCVLAKACEATRESLPDLVDHRLADMDARAIGADGGPTILVSPIRRERKRERSGGTATCLTINISGGGKLEPGLLDLGPFFSRLPETLRNALAEPPGPVVASRPLRGSESGSGQSRPFGLTPPVHLVLDVSPGVILSAEALHFLEYRFEVARNYARQQLLDISHRVQFEVISEPG